MLRVQCARETLPRPDKATLCALPVALHSRFVCTKACAGARDLRIAKVNDRTEYGYGEYCSSTSNACTRTIVGKTMMGDGKKNTYQAIYIGNPNRVNSISHSIAARSAAKAAVTTATVESSNMHK